MTKIEIEERIYDLEDELDDALVIVQELENAIREAKSEIRGGHYQDARRCD